MFKPKRNLSGHKKNWGHYPKCYHVAMGLILAPAFSQSFMEQFTA